jgi:DNA helicase-2/ATP-dependent DNA helicase PcrA
VAQTFERPRIKDLAAFREETLELAAPKTHKYDAYLAQKASVSTFNPSPMQQNFFNWIIDGQGSAILEAVAGAGKTTTLIHALKFMDGTVFFGAYNKSAADEIKAKAKKAGVERAGLRMGTVHSAGYSACMRAWPKTKVEDKKTSLIIRSMVENAPDLQTVFDGLGPFVAKLVSFGKQFLVGFSPKSKTWEEIAEHFSLDQDLTGGWTIETAIPYVREVFAKGNAINHAMIDYDDMISAPIYAGLRLFQNDWVLLDEVQDINPAREELARRMLKSNGRFIGVGDDAQAIYGFTGAGGGGIDRISLRFNCVRLPLTVTYRCPKAVVAYVHQWVSHIQAAPEAPEGCVRGPFISAEATPPGAEMVPWYVQEVPHPTSAILCRKTRPLISTAFGLLRRGTPCKVEGRDIGKGLVILATRWRTPSLDRLEVRLDQWVEREIAKAQATGSDRREQDAQDKYDTMVVFIERTRAQGGSKVSDLVTEIEKLFGDNVSQSGLVTLSTGHKAKGREWPVVYWLQTSGGRPCRKEWEETEERNIKYVIATRSQSELVLIPEGV